MALNPTQRSALIAGLGSVLETLDGAFLGLGAFLQKVLGAYLTAKNDLLDLKHFEFNPAFATRVISVPRAMEGFNELWDTIRLDLLGKYQEISFAVKNLTESIRADAISADASLDQPSTLAKAARGLGEIKSFLNQLGDLIVKVSELASILDDIKRRIETLDDLFLQQGKPKTTVDVHYRKRIS